MTSGIWTVQVRGQFETVLEHVVYIWRKCDILK